MILTSNRTREVHDALKRRCLYHWIDYPTAQKEYEIVLARVPEAPERLAREVVGLRPSPARGGPHQGARASPRRSTGRPRSCRSGPASCTPELVDETLGVVLKYEEDIRQVRGDTARRHPRRGRGERLRRPMTDPAVVQSAVRGRGRWAAPAGRVGRLRTGAPGGRLSIDIGAAVDFARALTLVDIGDREQVRGAGAAIFVRRRDDRATYDAVFDRWWRRRGSRLPGGFEPPPIGGQDERRRPAGGRGDRRRPGDGSETTEQRPDEAGVPMPASDDQDAEDEAPIAGIVISPDAYSQGEVLRHREFDRMTPAELREAERLVDALVPKLERRRTRRYELHSHGRRLAPRAMFRRNLGTGGQLLDWVWRRPIREPRSLVVLCDISGLDGAPLAAAAALRPGAVRGVGGPDRVVRVRDAAHPRHAAAARTATATARSPACPTP